MKSRKVKLILLSAIAAIAVSLLTVGYLTARPNDAPSGAFAGTLTITGGFERTDKVRFYSDKTSDCSGGCNIVRGTVTDADLSSTRTGTVVYQNIQTSGDTNGIFQILSGDGISTGAGVNGAVAGVLQGEKAATRNFTGDNTSVVFPLTTVALTAASIVNFNATVTSGGVSVLALGRTAVDRNGDGVVNATDVYTGSSATNSVSDLTTAATQATILSLAVNFADSVSIAAGGGTTRIDLSAKPVDLDGNFRFTATGDIVSVTVKSADNTALPFAITGDSPGIATGGAIIVKIEPFTACSTACVTVTTT